MAAAWLQRLDELAEQVRAGDESATDELYQLGYALVWSMVRRRGWYMPGGEQDDLVQEGMIGFMEAVRDWRPEMGRFQRFAGLCVLRELVMRIRTSNYEKRRILNEAARLDEPVPFSDRRPMTWLDVLVSHEGGPEDYLLSVEERQETSLLILGICQGMSRLERESLLRITSGQTYAQVAQALGTTVKAVDNAIQRARLKLRRRREAMSA